MLISLRKATLALGIVLALAGGLFYAKASPASSHEDERDYTYGNSGCDDLKDPQNMLFHYAPSWWQAAALDTELDVGWARIGGSNQYFRDHNSCSLMHTQRKSCIGPYNCPSDYHVRLLQGLDNGAGNTPYMGAGHGLRPRGSCLGVRWRQGNHDGSFQWAGHYTHYYWKGNTAAMLQCDNATWAWSDGYAGSRHGFYH